ncbi:MAG: exodeoxyribonuclease V subunit gamma [Pseudomonadota bacterium]
MALTVHRSNRAEVLAAHLAHEMGQPLPGACTPELLVVEGRGLERWLSQQVALRNGIWANVQVLFPRAMVGRVLDLVPAPDDDQVSIARFEPELTLWAVADLLVELQDRPSFAPLRNYLAGALPGSPRWLELSERLARTLDDYAVYRPRWIQHWEQGQRVPDHAEQHDWQAELWRALVGRLGPHHPPRRARDFFSALATGRLDVGALPPRLHLFGLTSLAPLYLRVLVALAEHSTVHLYLLSPSEAYWSDIQRHLGSHLREWREGAAELDLHYTLGHPLLASLGRQGRDMQRLLEALPEADELDDYRAPAPYLSSGQDGDAGATEDSAAPPTTMLQVVQEDMRRLQLRAAAGAVSASEQRVDPRPLLPGDRSITIHCCHSALREIEVLRDQLLDLFEHDDALVPADIAVLTPDIDAYAPAIDAVFGAPELARRLRYTVADRSARHSLDLVDGLLRLIELGRGRFDAPAVFDLLANPSLRRRHGVQPDEVARIEGWIRESGIRWGIDAEHRRSLGHPALDDNTWRAGLDRLLLGYAMPGEGRALFQGVLPFDDVEGSDAETLGKFLGLWQRLLAWHRQLSTARPVAQWAALLSGALDDFFAVGDEHEAEADLIRHTLDELAQRAGQAGYGREVELEAITTLLEPLVERGRVAQGFLRGAITFCGTVPMRAIPFKVLALVGMNDDSFPRQDRRPGFDLMAKKPLPGDRSRREDDRYLFLEALLSARQWLILTYTGRSVADNATRPPSVVVSELLDVLCDSFRLPDLSHEGQAVAAGSLRMKNALRQVLVQEHALQPFSPRNFVMAPASDDPRQHAADHTPRSHDAAACRGARALQQQAVPRSAFVDSPLPALDLGELSLDELARFCRDPLAWFFTRRLGLELSDRQDSLEPDEPLDLAGLSRWQVGSQLLAQALEGQDLELSRRVQRAAGQLPLGVVGDCALDEVEAQVRDLVRAARPLLQGAHRDVEVDLALGATRLTGTLRQVREQGLVQVSYSRDGGAQELALWLRHLVLCACSPEARHSTLLCRGEKAGSGPVQRIFSRPEDPGAILTSLVELCSLGSCLPLPLFKQASWTYARVLVEAKNEEDPAYALSKAREVFEGGFHLDAEADDPQVRQAFAHCDPLLQRIEIDGHSLGFADLALRLYRPLLRHRG